MQRQDGRKYEKTENEKILSLLAAGVLLLMSMSGCGKEAETGKTQVAMIVKSTESAFLKVSLRVPGRRLRNTI